MRGVTDRPKINATTRTNETELNESDYSNHLCTQHAGLTRVFVRLLDTRRSGVKGKQGCTAKTKTKDPCERQDSVTLCKANYLAITYMFIVCVVIVKLEQLQLLLHHAIVQKRVN